MKLNLPGHALGLALCALSHAAGAQGHAHQHGGLRLDVAAEAGNLSLLLQSPLDNLLGFERAPRTDAERRMTEAALARLKAADTLFKIDPAAGCKLAQVTLESAALGLGQADAKAGAGHADIDASFEFKCSGDSAYIDVELFAAYPRMQTIDVQLATPRGQFRRTLKRQSTSPSTPTSTPTSTPPSTRLSLRP